MNWRAADKVAAWKLFKRRMNVIFMANQVPEERQWALILVAGGDEAYNHWDTLEDAVEDCKKVDQVWDAFEKSFEQSTSFWHFRDAYLADFRQDESETRYANIERELLAIVFACQHFSTYLLGRSFVAESDHKPLEMIAMKNLANVPPRLQRMLLELQRYDVTIKYRPGKEMQLADALSRCPARASQEIKLDMRVDYIAFTKP